LEDDSIVARIELYNNILALKRSENTDGVFDNHKPVGRVLPVNAALIYDPGRLRPVPFLAPFQPVVRFFIKAEFNFRGRKIAANLSRKSH
jgi:hypothetical protein